MNVLVTGVSGLLGLNFALKLAQDHRVVGVYRRHGLIDPPFELLRADLSDTKQMANVLEVARPDVIINCAAMAILDRCEKEPEAAHAINTEMPGKLAKMAKRHGIALLHISTDAVFDGLADSYRESDIPNPLSVYGRTKYDGEQRVAAEYPQAIIARVNFFGSSLSGSRSLAEWFHKNLAAGRHVIGFSDVFFCPLFVDDLADILWQMIGLNLEGIFHVVSAECISKYDFGRLLAREFGLDETLISPSSWKDAGLIAIRSPKLCLETRKIEKALNRSMPGQLRGIQHFRQKIETGFLEQLDALVDRRN